MKQIYKRTLLLILILSLASNSMIASASSQKKSASYDLEKGGTQTFFILNEEGDYDEIIIEEISRNERADSKNYKVTHETSSWTAGFYVTISNNKITNAYSAFHSCASGTISSAYLSRTSTTKATYAFIYTTVFLKFNTGVIAEIVDSTLTVSKK